MHIKLLFFTSFLILTGCAATLPPEINSFTERESAIVDTHKYFSSVGDFKNSNDKVYIYSAQSIPSKSRPQNLQHYLINHCKYMNGQITYRGPKLLDNYPSFMACEIEDEPSFFFYSGTDHLSVHRTVHFVAEKKPSVSSIELTNYLNSIGYKTPQQRNTELQKKNAALEKENAKIAEKQRKLQEIIEPFYQEARTLELKRLKQAPRGSKVCKLSYTHYSIGSGQYRIQVYRRQFGYLEEHIGNRIKILEIPHYNQPQVSSWQDYDNIGICND